MPRRTRFAVAVSALVTCAAVAAVALADIVTVTDPRDTKPPGLDAFDIRKARAMHAPEGTGLRHVVTMQEASGATKRNTHLTVRAQGNTYRVSRGGVFDGATKIGGATVKRAGNRIVLRFDADTIGSPVSYRWRAFTAAPDHPFFDKAPNSGMVTHELIA